MTGVLTPEPLTAAAFAPFGTVIETSGAQSYPINGGTTTRFHALATADPGPGGEAILSIFRARRRFPRRTLLCAAGQPTPAGFIASPQRSSSPSTFAATSTITAG